jgi:MerR family transcriptional regulator, heat shock protein HspR
MNVPGPASERGVYAISVAAELVGIDPQSLRMYEARGLLEPDRTQGGTRRYSADDLDRLRRIRELLGDGLNLAGIGMVLDLELQNARLRAEQQEQRWRNRAAVSAPESPGRTSSSEKDSRTARQTKKK